MNALKYILKPKPNYKLSICAIIKNENVYLEEWLNYYLLIGVEHFYLYDNESKIPIKDTLKELKLDSHATVRKIKGQGQQMNAYSVIDQEAEEEIQSCEVCSGDILPDSAYTTSEEDGYSVCEKCSKEAQNEG